jgi:hypothetical protein
LKSVLADHMRAIAEPEVIESINTALNRESTDNHG